MRLRLLRVVQGLYSNSLGHVLLCAYHYNIIHMKFNDVTINSTMMSLYCVHIYHRIIIHMKFDDEYNDVIVAKDGRYC